MLMRETEACKAGLLRNQGRFSVIRAPKAEKAEGCMHARQALNAHSHKMDQSKQNTTVDLARAASSRVIPRYLQILWQGPI
jgi:hypothetical protein